jgi:carboxyl-terminal processing protease
MSLTGSRRPFTLLLLVALLLSVVPRPAFAAGPFGISFPVAAETARAQPGPIVKQAYDLLIDRFVLAPTPADVLNGGLDGADAHLKSKGVETSLGDRPAFDGNREGDWRRFVDRYAQIVDAGGAKISGDELDRAVVDGMARAMDEGHVYYIPPEIFQLLQAQLLNRNRYAGIGIMVNQERRVIDVFEESPAEQGGIRRGDQVVAVDGVSVEGMTPAQASEKIRGEPGTSVDITIRREATRESITITLQRAQVRVNWLTYRMLDENVGYMRIRTFSVPSALADFRRALEYFKEQNVKGLVIDVRGNGGGSVQTGEEILGTFIRSGPLYKRTDRQGGERTVTAFGDYWERDVPIAVLVDGSSASMSEILASALKENGVGHVIGTKTAGVVSATVYHPLQDGSALSVTALLIKSGLGKDLDRIGVQPDESVELDEQQLTFGRDNQLDSALSYIHHEAAARASRTAPVGGPRPDALPREA